jgi:hypothetical protein
VPVPLAPFTVRGNLSRVTVAAEKEREVRLQCQCLALFTVLSRLRSRRSCSSLRSVNQRQWRRSSSELWQTSPVPLAIAILDPSFFSLPPSLSPRNPVPFLRPAPSKNCSPFRTSKQRITSFSMRPLICGRGSLDSPDHYYCRAGGPGVVVVRRRNLESDIVN